MSSPDLGIGRFADHGNKLGQLGALTSAEQVGLALALAGDVLRRTKALHSLQQTANGVIEQVDSKAATAFVQAIDVVAENKRLEQALNDAFECMLTDANDSPGEQLTYRDRALANLAYRDRLTSIHAALVMTKATDAVKALEQKLAQVDAGLSKKARMLVGLNEARRAELDALDAGERAAAWWFASRSHCDALATIYAGDDARKVAHFESCEDCKRDAAAATGAHKPAHLDADSLRRKEDGSATTSENAWMDAHAKSCGACKRAIEALGVSIDA